MESLALVFSSGWASGVNAYLVVLVLGLSDRFGNFTEVPDVLGRWDVLGVAALLYCMEFVADKIPLVDSAWDIISTAIRPIAGAVVGIMLAGDADSLNAAVGGVVGGGSALASHLVKTGGRMAINTSPEPASNIFASLVEDAAVIGVVWFAIEHPIAAACLAAAFLLIGMVVLAYVARLVRRFWQRRRQRRRAALP
ncbi:DUF4126 domain-containing protein [Nocardioides sp. AE5]|uniref:DUF4126 domain-containing protein n=1 Tax=Nocardioides sp. AE5 TaxID=2962573 RepID=UPI0028812F6E|nr:DUF4126 domain-containing protein [Nocardioides sp. AE5]MDT0201238.1 DUF4126 domain-containing protein [Nocardioides sp. AE5]